MRKKPNLSKCKIEYSGTEYAVKVSGEDEKGAGGIWDLAGAFADSICEQLDGDIYFSDDLNAAYMIIQEAAYNLIKYSVLPCVKNHFDKENGIQM
jgi:hypothetical protein